ncbi:hypothetical protein JAAARDRAFT_27769 [Jaapia argillacea MUCL 33604]|uniref:Uncharacterized protein n=1 Tax=Jaapia argillacea MUCL 33604 TaxID=933084 RepID=A0A067QB08_9AGAM|nr:hypothetical protein JAAARDRAFT_27769 [Jaapia argillacea MUCL 33604]
MVHERAPKHHESSFSPNPSASSIQSPKNQSGRMGVRVVGGLSEFSVEEDSVFECREEREVRRVRGIGGSPPMPKPRGVAIRAEEDGRVEPAESRRLELLRGNDGLSEMSSGLLTALVGDVIVAVDVFVRDVGLRAPVMCCRPRKSCSYRVCAR